MSLNENQAPSGHYRQRLLHRGPPRLFCLATLGIGLGLAAASFFWNAEAWESEDRTENLSSIGEGWISADEIGPIQRSMVMEIDLDGFTAEQFALMEKKEVLSTYIASTYRRSLPEVRQIVDYAWESGDRYDVDPVLLLSIAAVESSFNPEAVSSVGAQGLLQALPRAHPEKFARVFEQGKSPFDPDASLDLGGQIYAEYRTRFKGDKVLTLQQYNGSLRDSSRRYSNKVLRMYRSLNARLPPFHHDA